MNATLSYGGRTWRFETPRGVRTVRGKDKDPVWTPPEWHFAEVALEHGLKLRSMRRGQAITLKDGTILTSKRDEVGIIRQGTKSSCRWCSTSTSCSTTRSSSRPQGTKHRTIKGELGHYRLDLGDGYLLHGTPYAQVDRRRGDARVRPARRRGHRVALRERAGGDEGLHLLADRP